MGTEKASKGVEERAAGSPEAPPPLSNEQRQLYQTVFLRARPALHALALRLTRDEDEARDLLQETMLRAVRHAARLASDGDIDVWLHVVLRHVFYDRRRARHWTVQLSDTLLAAVPAPVPEPEPAWQSLSTGSVLAASDRLPATLRQPFHLYVRGASYDDIAAQLRLRKQTVGTRLHRARRRLRTVLQAGERDPAAQCEDSSLSSAA